MAFNNANRHALTGCIPGHVLMSSFNGPMVFSHSHVSQSEISNIATDHGCCKKTDPKKHPDIFKKPS